MNLKWQPEAEIPLYRQLKDIFLACAESGEWAPGALIPTENELAAAFGVSKGPIRQALGQLVREGLLERRQGRGTWVLPRPAEWSTLSGISIARLIEQRGQPHRTTVRQFATIAAASSIAAGLGCAAGTPIYRIELVRNAGDLPVALETLHVPQRLLPGLRQDLLGGEESIYYLLQQAGHGNTHSHQSVQAVTFGRYEAAALGVTRGAPALLVTNRAFDRADTVLVYSFVLLRGDYFRISIALPPRARTELVQAEIVTSAPRTTTALGSAPHRTRGERMTAPLAQIARNGSTAVGTGAIGTGAVGTGAVGKGLVAAGARRATRRRYLQSAAALAGAALLGGTPVAGVRAQEGQPSSLAGTFRIWVSAYFPITGDPMWKDMFDGFQAKYPRLKLDIGEGVARGDAEVLAKAGTTFASGDPEDVLHMGGIFGGDYAGAGWIRSLDPYFATSTLLQKSDLWPAWVADSIYQGESYALSFAGDVRVLYLHKDAWRRAGLDPRQPPRTWAELEDFAQRLSRKDASGNLEIVGFNPGLVQWLWPFFQLGGEMLDPTGEKIVLDRGDAGIKTLESYMRLFDIQGGREAFTKFHLANGASEQTAGNPTPSPDIYNGLFQQGKVAMYVNTYSHRSEQFRPQGFIDDQWDFAAYPIPRGGRQANWGGSHAFGIPVLAKNPDAGWAWLEHFSLYENDLKFCTHYDRVPIRPATAATDEYIQGDPFRAHQSEQAWYRRFFPGILGIREIIPFWNRPLAEVYTGQRGPRDAITQAARDMQAALDRAHGRT